MARHLLIRADANTQIGTGHVMRCLALAQAWQDQGGTATLVARELPEGLQRILRSEQLEIITSPSFSETEDANNLVALAKDLASECVVVDGYSFRIVHQRALRDAGIRHLFIDDYGHASEYVADFVLNQNISAEESLYRNRAPQTRLLLGTKYALLRREFRQFAVWQREIAPIATNILVTMGGADEGNISGRVLRALRRVANTDTKVRVIAGPANHHRAALEAMQDDSPEVEILVSPNMPEVMKWADIAVSAAGSTCWELMFMGLPFLAVAVAENQLKVASRLRDSAIADVFSSAEDMEQEELGARLKELIANSRERIRRSELGRRLVDGCGAMRIINRLRGCDLDLTAATESDCRLVWQWANEPSTRAASFQSNIISWDEHVAWFNAQLHNSNSRLWIARNRAGKPIGQVRFLLDGKDATISIGIDAQERGHGYGQELITLGSDKIARETNVNKVHAYIKPENKASVEAFKKAGFAETVPTSIKGQTALHFVLEIRRTESS